MKEQSTSAPGSLFRVISGLGCEEASSVVLSMPSKPFLYLSSDSQHPRGSLFPGVSSQDTLSSPILSDSVFRVERASDSQVNISLVASEAETVSEVESDRADSTQDKLPQASSKWSRVSNKREEVRRLNAPWPVLLWSQLMPRGCCLAEWPLLCIRPWTCSEIHSLLPNHGEAGPSCHSTLIGWLLWEGLPPC